MPEAGGRNRSGMEKPEKDMGDRNSREEKRYGRRLVHKRGGKTRKSWGTRTAEMRNKGKERRCIR